MYQKQILECLIEIQTKNYLSSSIRGTWELVLLVLCLCCCCFKWGLEWAIRDNIMVIWFRYSCSFYLKFLFVLLVVFLFLFSCDVWYSFGSFPVFVLCFFCILFFLFSCVSPCFFWSLSFSSWFFFFRFSPFLICLLFAVWRFYTYHCLLRADVKA